MKHVSMRTVCTSHDFLLMHIGWSKMLGITKCLTSEAEAPALQLSFMIICVPKEEMFGEDTNDDKRVQIGMPIHQP